MEETTAYKNFKSEFRRIITLYNAVIYSFKIARNEIGDKIYNPDIKFDPQKKIYRDDIEEEMYLISGNAYELRNCFNKRFQRNIREVLLVRLISLLEVYLVETVKEIFINRKDLFHLNKKIDFNYNELLASKNITNLWTKLISKESRNLQNQGFIEIKKYFYKNFSIDFNNFEEISLIEKYHDIRHILVHRLGKYDQQFQHKYQTTERTVNIKDDEFNKFIEILSKKSKFINDHVSLLINNKNHSKCSDHEIYNLKICILDDDAYNYIDNDFCFFKDEKLNRLRDILLQKSMEDNYVTFKLSSSNTVLKEYRRIIKGCEKKGLLKIIKSTNKAKVEVSETIKEQVKSELPSKPYPVDIHKTIAKKLSISNSITYQAISDLNNET